ncbi:DUF72 domain-containing protein [Rhodopila globiformis]|uniref:DUF72 domain-containing protein n=1 Tax=Rhodopila globiformis TaxID=1071 RepID=A0A2S6MY56_RHOGL|nr:DUF72 domain-containing protein [Rhodopila globiformis]PPQ27303.1 hypothetical protein CCS01_27535 [Rhodopila globiformis]
MPRLEVNTPTTPTFRIGTAGWSIPKTCASAFGGEGTYLQRYARVLPAVEIDTSFYRPHKPATYARWAASVPPGFRFAVKLPREITHIRRLVGIEEALGRFLEEAQALGGALGPLLVQLPPSLGFDSTVAAGFFGSLRARFGGLVVCEPRHASWFTDAVDALLSDVQVARAAADPPPVPRAVMPGGWPGLIYRRLHGSPQMYHSAYGPDAVAAVARQMQETAVPDREDWCIFDNTALGEATPNALDLLHRLPIMWETQR